MLLILDVKSCPNGKFRMIVPRTGVQLSHFEYQSFVNLYLNHLRQNNIPVGIGWEEEMQDELCRQNPQWKGVCQDANPPKNHRISNGDVRNFLTSVGRMIETEVKGGDAFVSQEEANRRAEICVACEKNRETINWCPNCPGSVVRSVKKFRDYFKGKSPDLTTPLDDKLKACEICGCSNAVQIHCSTAVLSHVKTREPYPSNCWKSCNSSNSSSP